MKDNTEKKGKLIRKQIEIYLTEKGYNIDAFSYLIEMFVTEYRIYLQAVTAISVEGLTVAGNGDGTFRVKNPNVTTKNESLKNIQSISKQMGLSVHDSLIFKLLNEGNENDEDGFDYLNYNKN
ncbi:P27 family phage terminase small subunit [Rufibacter sp. LB8]|uniref:P27 family phage terminase small subunit n=1 Tax=Rufibacter sp. LB8 TaxID=2777781 RepID=UPI00178C829D|nr:P27 family phage terminase small subunit [Rufibacter sp. LB8]